MISESSINIGMLQLVDAVAQNSLDRSTKIGAVLRTDYGIVVGCNNFPAGVKDTDERHERPTKYFYFEHAERNVIFEAAKRCMSTEGATLYTTGIPCADCARACIQAGIKHIVVWKKGSGLEATSRWSESIEHGKTMLSEAGVSITEVERC